MRLAWPAPIGHRLPLVSLCSQDPKTLPAAASKMNKPPRFREKQYFEVLVRTPNGVSHASTFVHGNRTSIFPLQHQNQKDRMRAVERECWWASTRELSPAACRAEHGVCLTLRSLAS